jgi:hypothetical protein
MDHISHAIDITLRLQEVRAALGPATVEDVLVWGILSVSKAHAAQSRSARPSANMIVKVGVTSPSAA